MKRRDEEKKNHHALTQRTSSATSAPVSAISNFSPSFYENDDPLTTQNDDDFYEAMHRRESHYSRYQSQSEREEFQKN